MMVYRRFACADEALNVLICQTVGVVKVIQDALDRKGIIEYKTDFR